MKLTNSRQKVIDRAKDLEQEYGKGNVFLRYINDYWKAMFIIHNQNETTFKTMLQDVNKVNGKIINSLEEKGLLQIMDNKHNILNNAMDVKYDKERYLVGSRIATELV